MPKNTGRAGWSFVEFASAALRFLGGAGLGALVMAFLGVQALVEICSSISLAKRQKQKFPAFDLPRAFRRIVLRTVFCALAAAVISALVICFTALPGTFGYLAGMILWFLKNLGRMTPNNSRNQRRFRRLFADCYEGGDDDTKPLPRL